MDTDRTGGCALHSRETSTGLYHEMLGPNLPWSEQYVDHLVSVFYIAHRCICGQLVWKRKLLSYQPVLRLSPRRQELANFNQSIILYQQLGQNVEPASSTLFYASTSRRHAPYHTAGSNFITQGNCSEIWNQCYCNYIKHHSTTAQSRT